MRRQAGRQVRQLPAGVAQVPERGFEVVVFRRVVGAAGERVGADQRTRGILGTHRLRALRAERLTHGFHIGGGGVGGRGLGTGG